MVTKVIIIGGGISGLVFANLCKKYAIPYLILEASTRLGGCIESVSAKHANFFIELGAHSIYRSYNNTHQLLQGVNLSPIRRVVKFTSAQKLQSLMSTVSLISLPAIATLPFKLKKMQGKTIANFLPTVLGQRFYDLVARPALRALLCQSPDDYPLEMLTPASAKNKNRALPKISRPADGMEAIIRIIATDLSSKLNNKVIKLVKETNKYTVETANGEHYTATHVVFACGAKGAYKLASQLIAEPNQKLELDLESNFKSYGVFFAANCSDNKYQPNMQDQIIINRDQLSGIDANNLYWSMLVWYATRELVGATIHTPIALSSEQIQLILTKTVNIKNNQIVDIICKDNSMPKITYQNRLRFLKISSLLPNNIALIGNAVSKLSIESCIESAIDKFAKMFPWL